MFEAFLNVIGTLAAMVWIVVFASGYRNYKSYKGDVDG